jgi:hypothetical protein
MIKNYILFVMDVCVSRILSSHPILKSVVPSLSSLSLLLPLLLFVETETKPVIAPLCSLFNNVSSKLSFTVLDAHTINTGIHINITIATTTSSTNIFLSFLLFLNIGNRCSRYHSYYHHLYYYYQHHYYHYHHHSHSSLNTKIE